jgi:hypothetical protein
MADERQNSRPCSNRGIGAMAANGDRRLDHGGLSATVEVEGDERGTD